MGFMYNFKFMARAFIFGNIQMSNITDIYSTGKINGVTGVGKQDSSSVNGTPAYTELARYVCQIDASPRNICSAGNNDAYVQNGVIDSSTYVFNNLSGFAQPQNRIYKDPSSNPFYSIDGTRDGDDLYALTYIGDC